MVGCEESFHGNECFGGSGGGIAGGGCGSGCKMDIAVGSGCIFVSWYWSRALWQSGRSRIGMDCFGCGQGWLVSCTSGCAVCCSGSFGCGVKPNAFRPLSFFSSSSFAGWAGAVVEGGAEVNRGCFGLGGSGTHPQTWRVGCSNGWGHPQSWGNGASGLNSWGHSRSWSK